MLRIKTIGLLLTSVLLACSFSVSANPALNISKEQATRIGIKIWYNESGGTVSGLTHWNKNENFASLGIGHFIWYPAGVKDHYNESFPNLLHYLGAHGVTLPDWLQGNLVPYNPWPNRHAFNRSMTDPRMVQIRNLLLHTIPLQEQYMAERVDNTLPNLLARAPFEQRTAIKKRFLALTKTPNGVYALEDYVNFKGEGLGNYRKHRGWGLLQVLEKMQQAPSKDSPLQAFVWAANKVLTTRVAQSNSHLHEKLWLAGWRHRLNSYLS